MNISPFVASDFIVLFPLFLCGKTGEEDGGHPIILSRGLKKVPSRAFSGCWKGNEFAFPVG